MRKGLRLLLIFSGLYFAQGSFAQITCGFASNDSAGCAPYILTDTARETSGYPIIRRKWSIDLCGGANIVPPTAGNNIYFSYVLSNPGCYCVTLTSYNSNGDSCTLRKCNITVAADPTVGFLFSPVEGCLPLTVHGTCTLSAGSGIINKVIIDWGCAGVDSFTSCSTISKTYTSAFCQTPTCPNVAYQSPIIVIRNSYGCYATQTYHNQIRIIADPVASFTADTTIANCVNTPLISHFTADSCAPNVTYTWYVNGVQQQSSLSRFFTHSFPVSVNCYDIKLVVRHPSGCADSLTKTGYLRSDFTFNNFYHYSCNRRLCECPELRYSCAS